MALELHIVGLAGDICTVQADRSSTWWELKARIEKSTGIRAVAQRLFIGTQELVGLRQLADYLRAGAREETVVLVRHNPLAIRWKERFLQGDQGLEFRRASAEIRADAEVVLEVVTKDGWVLQHASAKLRADRDIVWAAVSQDAWALQFASAELRADRDVILAAITQQPCALQFASQQLRADRAVVLAAGERNRLACQFASAELRAVLGANGEAFPNMVDPQGCESHAALRAELGAGPVWCILFAVLVPAVLVTAVLVPAIRFALGYPFMIA